MSTPTPRANLAATLAAAGHPLLELSAPGQGALLVLPFGGRVLGLFTDAPASDNFLWTNPRLAEAHSARTLLTAPGWAHTGGDRIWISPEVETHVGDLADPWGTFAVAAPVDPGQYAATHRGDSITLYTPARVKFHRSQVEVPLRIDRTLRLIPNPLPPELQSTGLAYAGYEQAATLRLDEPAGAPPVSLWSLLVLPVSGWMIVPTRGQVAARDYFEPTGPNRLVSTPEAVHFRIDGQEQHKIALRASELRGGAGYWRTINPQRRTLVVRRWPIDPRATYADTPWEARGEPGYAFQSYNGSEWLGAFGELEYHTPAIGGASGASLLTDTSQLFAFSGRPEQIDPIARALLDIDHLPGTP